MTVLTYSENTTQLCTKVFGKYFEFLHEARNSIAVFC